MADTPKFQQLYIKKSVELFDEQKEFVKQLVHRKRCIISAKTGAGKTLICLYAYSYLKEKGYINNLLVLTPLNAHDKRVWYNDMQKFTSFRSISLEDLADKLDANGTNLYKYLGYYDVIYGKHTHLKNEKMLRIISAIVTQPKTLLCVDEVHAFRNPSAAMTKILTSVVKFSHAFWGVSATLVSVGAENLYHIVNLVKPWYLGSFTQFRDHYCNVTEEVIGRLPNGQLRKVQVIQGLKHPKELQEYLDPLVLSGESFFELHHQFIDYTLDSYEQGIYTKITNGITCLPDQDPEQWFNDLMNDRLDTSSAPKMKDPESFSSRYVYLQYAADGIISDRGEYTRYNSTKIQRLGQLCKEVTDKGQSMLVYCDYLITVDLIHKYLAENLRNVVILESTGTHYLKPGSVTEGTVKLKPHIILCSRASSESASYYFINNVCFFEIPTVPATAIQMCGRITRKNSLYPDDLNVYWFRSDNIDEYKMRMVSSKAKIQEDATGAGDNNIPDTYKEIMTRKNSIERAKRLLLWQR